MKEIQLFFPPFFFNDVFGSVKAYQSECWCNQRRDKEPVVSEALKGGLKKKSTLRCQIKHYVVQCREIPNTVLKQFFFFLAKYWVDLSSPSGVMAPMSPFFKTRGSSSVARIATLIIQICLGEIAALSRGASRHKK